MVKISESKYLVGGLNMKDKDAKEKGSSDEGGKMVVVAVKALKEIPKTALVWALTHVVQPGDCIKLLVVIPARSSSNFYCFTFLFSFPV